MNKCYKCGTTENVTHNTNKANGKQSECFKCSIKLRYNLTLPGPTVAPEWLEMAKKSHKLILERRT